MYIGSYYQENILYAKILNHLPIIRDVLRQLWLGGGGEGHLQNVTNKFIFDQPFCTEHTETMTIFASIITFLTISQNEG